jgi:hypothetical protein
MQEGPRHERIHPGSTERVPERNLEEIEARNYVWAPTEVLNWVMMQWLPGMYSILVEICTWLTQIRT